MAPDGGVYLLDRDELDAALGKDEITMEQYTTALKTAGEILMRLTGKKLPSRRCHYIKIGDALKTQLDAIAGTLAPLLALIGEKNA